MDYSLRYLKRREIFPTKVAKVEWNQSKQMRSMTPMSERPSMKYSSHKPTTTPFFTRKMTQFVKKNQVNQCLKIINMLKKLECEEDLRKLAIIGDCGRGRQTFREGFPMRQSWRLRSAKLSTKHHLGLHEHTEKNEQLPIKPSSTYASTRAKSASLH